MRDIPLPLRANEIVQRMRMFEKEKQNNQGEEWLGEEERKEGREDQNIVLLFFLIIVSTNERYFRFLHLLM